jgi:hypothetical protein
MKPSAYSRNKFSGDLYKFTVTNVGKTPKVDYYFAGTLTLTADLDSNQRLTLKTDEPVAIGCLVANIKDRNGNLILDDQIWQITTLNPVFNAFNSIENYRSRATKFQGELNV